MNLVNRLLFFFVAFALPIGVQANVAFSASFEPAGLVPIDSATVELRSRESTVKVYTQAKPWGQFRICPSSQIVAGDVVVAYASTWEGPAFEGEFRTPKDGRSTPPAIKMGVHAHG